MDASAILCEARAARGRTVMDIARETRMPLSAVAAIDSGRFDQLPPGVYARSWLRTYARAVGVDPEGLLVSLEPVLPTVNETLADIQRLRDSVDNQAAWSRYSGAVLAVLVDAVVLMGLNSLIWAISALVCNCSVWEILQLASAPLLALFLITLVLYVGLFGAIGGRTAGPALFGLDILPRPPRRLTPRAIRERATSYLLCEVRILTCR